MNNQISHLIEQLLEIQEGSPWIGCNYNKKMERIGDEDFFKRPLPELHSPAEIISHLTTWRQETLLKIRTGEGSLLDSDPSNWKELDELRRKGRNLLMDDYRISLDKIIELLRKKSDSFLEMNYYDADFKKDSSYGWLLNGMLHHDIYHLGQLAHCVKLLENNP